MITLFAAILLCLSLNDAVLVKVRQGLLKGEIVPNEVDSSAIYSFKGIPYAQPPVGKLRFKAPQPISTWKGVKNATKHGAICPQVDFLTGEIPSANEDCLFLNIYSPNLNFTASLSVMFFIHGGGYISGSGNDDLFGPDFIVRKNVLLVTINYRLGPLGFLTLDIKEVPGNAGLKDQVLALKWVHDNIKSFGGDPNQITIIGQSAGSASVLYHLASPSTKGLFKRAIAMSGTPSCEFSFAYKPTRRPYILAKILGKETTNPKSTLEFLQSVNATNFVGLNVTLLGTESFSEDNILRHFYFTPVVEKKFGSEQYLTKNYLDKVKKGALRNVDLFLGSTNLETVYTSSKVNIALKKLNKYPELFLVREILDQVTPDTSLEIADLTKYRYFGNKSRTMENVVEYFKYSSDIFYSAIIRRFADLVSEKLSNVFFYKFASFSSRNYFGKMGVPYGLYVAGHSDDLNYFMNPKSLNFTIDTNSIEFEMIDLMTNVITNFIKNGTPTPDNSLGLIWPKYDRTRKKYVTISNVTLIPGCNPDSSGTAFRNSIYEKAGINY